jgi:hypothetical protein
MDMYATNLLQLASYLCTFTDIKLVGLDKANPSRILFQFEPKDEAQKLADNYFNGASAPVIEVFRNFNYLKDLLFEARRNINEDPSN